MFRTILVPVDIDDLEIARPAIDGALELARPGGGSVRLLHVRTISPVAYAEFAPTDVETGSADSAEARLAALAATLDLPSGRVSAVVRRGSVTEEVVAEANAMAADLIVIGAHDPTVASFFLGSHSGSLVRDARCSLLVVRR